MRRRRPGAIAEVFVDVSAGFDDGGDDDGEQFIEATHRFLGGVGVGVGGEVADVDEQCGHVSVFTAKDVVALFEEAGGRGAGST